MSSKDHIPSNNEEKLYSLKQEEDKVSKQEFKKTINSSLKKEKKTAIVKEEKSKEVSSIEVFTESSLKEQVKNQPVNENKEVKNKFYLIIYFEDDKENKIFTPFQPTFQDFNLVIKQPFSQELFSETILGKITIKQACKKELNIEEIIIPASCTLIVTEEQEWMSKSYDETKKDFDEKILNKYRELSKTVEVKTIQEQQQENLGEFTSSPSQLLENNNLNKSIKPPLTEEDWFLKD